MVAIARRFAIFALAFLVEAAAPPPLALAQPAAAPQAAAQAALPASVESAELADAAERYAKVLRARTGAARPDPAAAQAARQRGDDHAKARRWPQAVSEYETAIVRGLDDQRTWLELARALEQARNDRAAAAARVALDKARVPVDRANALYVLARQFDRGGRQRDALAVYDAAIALAPAEAAVKRRDELKRIVAFRVVGVTVTAETEQPQICLRFNYELTRTKGFAFQDYVRSEPEVRGDVSGRGTNLCVDGVAHGQVYVLTVRQGLPAENGDRLEQSQQVRAIVRDREPSVAFRGPAYVLPQEGSRGVPLTAVNSVRARLQLLRVNDRALVEQVARDGFSAGLAKAEVDDIADQTGSRVWTGEIDLPQGERNRPRSALVPISEMVRERKPGLYLLVAEPVEGRRSEYAELATQWVLVSDLGVTSLTGEDGLTVVARRLGTAAPADGVEVRLYARNNAELGQAVTGADGLARFPAPALRGPGGDSPAVVMLYGPGGDFNFLSLVRPAFDLSDRGVSGRPVPGPLDAFLYGDRGVYRPGETAHLTALLRNDRGRAEPGLPLTLKVLRPDGVEVVKTTLTSTAGGGYHLPVPIADRARTGKWSVQAFVDPKGKPVGRMEFSVEDIAPPTIEVAIEAAGEQAKPGVALPVTMTGRFFYGAPAVGAGAEAEVIVAAAADPYPMHKGYRFGPVDREVEPQRIEIEPAAADAEGKTRFEVKLGALPETTVPLDVTVRGSMFEPGGRPVTRSLTLPVAARPFDIGIRARAGDAAVADGQPAAFDVIAVDRQGRPVAAPDLRFELVSERWNWQWYNQYGEWKYRAVVQDRRQEAGALAVAQTLPAAFERTLAAGRWRLDVFDPKTGAASSFRFRVGWWVGAEAPEVPDRLEVALEKPRYRPGETARIFLKGPFAGEAVVAVVSNRVHLVRSVALAGAGSTLELPVDADWGAGVYVLATGLRPAGAADALGPGRAVGVAWMPVERAETTLAVRIEAPEVVRPRRTQEVTVRVAGAGSSGAAGGSAHLTLAAVDEGVLRLTDFRTPAPGEHFFGRRRLGVDMRDLYGRLLDGRTGEVGRLRSGGDDTAERNLGGLPRKNIRIAAVFSGIVALDAEGKATIPLAVPDFQGRLRLMAVAWSADAVGSAEGAMTVRDPVASLVATPRFLAPGDAAQATVSLDNVDGAAGEYVLRLAGEGAVRIEAPPEVKVVLEPGKRFEQAFPLTGTRIGDGRVRLALSGPQGFAVDREWDLSVRPTQPYETRRIVGRIEPGQSLALGPDLVADLLPGTAEVFLNLSPRPGWDVAGLIRDLDRYPYGCVEQTTSVAMPLLYLADVAREWQLPGQRVDAKTRIDAALRRLADMQQADGSFGLWGAFDASDPWLTAYVVDFFARARDQGHLVSDPALKNAVDYLAAYVRRNPSDAAELTAHAYAHYALARAGVGDVGGVRYFSDVHLNRLPTALAQAQVGAALALYGDGPRAAAAFAAATAAPSPVALVSSRNYGSELRDRAGVLALAAEAGVPIQRAATLAEDIAQRFQRRRYTSTQEKVWLLLAAHALARSGGPMTVAVDDNPARISNRALSLKPRIEGAQDRMTVANRGEDPVWRSISVSGVPRDLRPPENHGFVLERRFHLPDGKPADLARLRQNDLVVVVVSGEWAETEADGANALLVDLIPAGFELENARLAGGRGAQDFAWLPDLTEATHTELRDDRFVAGLTLSKGDAAFTQAYLMRAVTPGRYVVPGSYVEDMYRPERFARTAAGTATIGRR
ncbi:alpha-2-macroglobulin [Stella sp.]|uniref:alpha-2-macroglobulin family protein n=1 Tax=Stella sp. TaxID=2912054 RepID=UPI0035AF6E75